MAWLSELKRTLQKLGEPEAERPDRWPVTGLTALYGVQSPSTLASVRDISFSGVFLEASEPLSIGERVHLTVRMAGPPELSAEMEFTTQAEVVRRVESGLGLKFVLPSGLDPAAWEVLLHSIVAFPSPNQAVEAFRTLRTVLFLYRLCEEGAKETFQLMGGQFDQDRTRTLFKIARDAEKLLAADPDFNRMRAHPHLVASLLRDGSWASDELVTRLWVGLFISSCTTGQPDDSNQILVDLLVHVTPCQARIYTHACERALSGASASGDIAPIVLGPEEIVKLTGITDLSRNATDLAYLFNLGLIQKLFDFTSYRDVDTFDITPSRLGIELYKHCQGQRGAIDPQFVTASRERLAVFFPSGLPIP